ncbi:hypothetical protein HGRIS_000885 [Hohenbuehelia grisea]|uniref:Carboxylic ester hydrolase n=1 Tax=Hohenbuehelia grisea TaxID=104357 RepID=A0ABR3IQ15_9AGAR
MKALLLQTLFAVTLYSSLGNAHQILVSVSESPIVDLGYAKYQGFFNQTSNVTTFLGVRYAEAPTGDLRWRSPITPKKADDIQSALVQPPECFQGNLGQNPEAPIPVNRLQSRATTPSEDCLFLNVYTPGHLNSPSSLLPVVVWIHGGGYTVGSASGFDGNDLIREAGRGAVVVIIQYRLGLLGFLSSAEVKANGSPNAGLLDQQFALQWVQSHIHRFGGDKSHVVLWGESAGAGSIVQHIVANGGRTNPPLFKAGITVQIPVYLHNLFPALTEKQIADATALYAPLGTQFTQAQLIMTEVVFWCPTYSLLKGFSGKPTFKGHFAIPPALHGNDVAYYFPTTSGPPPFNNSAFDAAFSEAFLDFAMFFDPNIKFRPVITPRWRPWTANDQVEMLFNRTTEGEPDIRQIPISQGVLERCDFWESISANIPQ